MGDAGSRGKVMVRMLAVWYADYGVFIGNVDTVSARRDDDSHRQSRERKMQNAVDAALCRAYRWGESSSPWQDTFEVA